jgi:hypothetical protein
MLFLAINEEIQSKLYEEIISFLPSVNAKITYEAINQMNLLDRVLKEGLRLGSEINKNVTLTKIYISVDFPSSFRCSGYHATRNK